MSLNITKFEGTVSIADVNYKFSCNGTGLIFDVDHTAAMAILNCFSSGGTKSTIEAFVESPTVTTTEPPSVVGITVTEPVEEKPAPKKRGRPRKKKVPEIEAAKEIDAEKAKEVLAEASEVLSESEQSDPPDEIKNARQLKGIVSYFVDLGVTNAATIAAECEKYRESVPLLSRATKLEERIERILVLIGVANDG